MISEEVSAGELGWTIRKIPLNDGFDESGDDCPKCEYPLVRMGTERPYQYCNKCGHYVPPSDNKEINEQ